MTTILVTGANGFVGRNALRSLAAHGYEVHATTRSARFEEGIPAVQWHTFDLLDSEQVTSTLRRIRPSHMLHFAWYTEPEKYWTSPENFRWVEATKGLLTEFQRHGGRRVVFAGLGAVNLPAQTTNAAPACGICSTSIRPT